MPDAAAGRATDNSGEAPAGGEESQAAPGPAVPASALQDSRGVQRKRKASIIDPAEAEGSPGIEDTNIDDAPAASGQERRRRHRRVLRHTEIAGRRADEPAYACPECGQTFADMISGELHRRQAHRG